MHLRGPPLLLPDGGGGVILQSAYTGYPLFLLKAFGMALL